MSQKVERTFAPQVGLARSLLIFILVFFTVINFMSSPAIGADNDDSEHEYHNNELTFLLVSLVMSYGAMAILTSLFTFRFGQRRSKLIAIPVLSSGVLIWGTWIFFKFIFRADYPDDTIIGIIHWSAAPILKPLLAVVGVIIGSGIAVFIFLTVVVRS
jgi:hypothetical protein